MANVTIQDKPKSAPKPTVDNFSGEDTEVVLTLSMEEALTLHALVGCPLGSSRTTARKHSDAIYYALEDGGVDSDAYPDFLELSTPEWPKFPEPRG